MDIVIGKGLGHWIFGMTKGQVIDLLEEDASVQKQRIISKNYDFFSIQEPY